MICSNCQNPLVGHEKFCSKCGRIVDIDKFEVPHFELFQGNNTESPIDDFQAAKESKKTQIIAIAIIFIISIGGYLSFDFFQKRQSSEKTGQLINKYESVINKIESEYIILQGAKNIEDITSGMNKMASTTIDITNLINNEITPNVESLAKSDKFIELHKKYIFLNQKITAMNAANNLAIQAADKQTQDKTFPNPSQSDIADIINEAEQLRSTISSLPRVEQGGDPRYNDIAIQTASARVGPIAQQFNATCARFQSMYGEANLQLVARQNGFSDLLPNIQN